MADNVLSSRNGILDFIFGKGNSLAGEVTADRLNAMVASINKAQITSVVNGTFRSSPKGTAIVCSPVSNPPQPTHPYKGVDVSADNVPMVTVTPGMHNSVVPTIDGVPITGSGSPLVFPALTLGHTDKIVYVEITWVAGVGGGSPTISVAEISSSSSGVPPNDAIASDGSGTSYQTLFFVNLDFSDSGDLTLTIMDGVSGSQMAQVCGIGVLYGLM